MVKNNPADDRPVGVAIGFLLVGLMLILVSAGFLSESVGAFLWNMQDDPSPSWVWACGGVGSVCMAIFMLLPLDQYKPQPVSAAAGGLGLLHLFVFFIAILF